MKKKLIFTLFLSSLLNTNPFYAQSENSGRERPYRATHTKTTKLKHTKLKVSFDYQKEQMHGEEWLTAKPFFYPTDSLVLNAKAMLIHQVAMEQNGKKKPLKYSYKDDILNINLGRLYTKNEDYTVYIKYTARPNEVKQKGSNAISDAKGLYFINAQGKDPDTPTQIWTQGETESSSAWFPTIDKPNQKTTQEIYMTVPDKYVTLSNGLLKSSKKEANNLRTDHWVMEQKHAPYLFFMGVGEYAIIRDKWRNIPVDYYVEKEYAPYAKQIYGNTPEMLEFFSKYLNYDYPWVKYAQISGRDYVSGAMENTTATIHSESILQKPGQLIDKNKRESTIVHEIFHHWFGNLVTTESWSNLAVNESFATYSEYLWFQHKYGKDKADEHLMNKVGRYLSNPSDFNKNLVRFNYNDKEDMFDAVSYPKGCAILHMLRNYLGDDAFREGLTDYLKTNEYSTAEVHQVRLSMEKVSGKDLNWFFNQWFFSNGHPRLSYNYDYNADKKQVTLNINQKQTPLFEFPLAVDVYQNGKPTRHKVWVHANSSNTFVFPISGDPDLININADGVLLSEITEEKTSKQYLLQYQNSKEFLSRHKAIEYAYKNADKDETSLKILILGLKDPFYKMRILALNALDLSKPNQAKLVLTQVEKMATNDPKTLVQAAAISALAKTKDKQYLKLYEKTFSDVSNAVRENSLMAIMSIDPEKAADYINKIELNDDSNKDLIMMLLPNIIKNKKKKHMPAVAQIAVFYPFIKMEDPKKGQLAKEAYDWIMGSNNIKATKYITTFFKNIREAIGENMQTKEFFLEALKSGFNLKKQALSQEPKNPELKQQVDWIAETIDAYNK